MMLKKRRGRLLGLSDFGLRGGGLVNGHKYAELIALMLGHKTFADTRIPLRIIATELGSGQPFIFKEGRLSFAVQASSSVPVIFEPAKHQSRRFVDGALSDPVPVKILKELGATDVIAVNLYHKNEFVEKRFTFTKVALRSTRIALYNLSHISIKEADVVINPDTSQRLQNVGLRDFFSESTIKDVIAIGRRSAQRHLAEIKKLL